MAKRERDTKENMNEEDFGRRFFVIEEIKSTSMDCPRQEDKHRAAKMIHKKRRGVKPEQDAKDNLVKGSVIDGRFLIIDEIKSFSSCPRQEDIHRAAKKNRKFVNDPSSSRKVARVLFPIFAKK